MTSRQKTALYFILALALLILPVSSSRAQDSFDDLKNFHDAYDFDALQKRGEELARMAESMPAIYSEKASLEQKYDPPGYLAEVSFEAESVEGATTKTDLKAGYAPGTTLEVEGRLTVAKGSYKAEFKNQGQVSLTLEAKDGSSAEGRGLVTVDADGSLPFEVTAAQAEGVVLNLKVRVPEKPKE